METLLFGLCAWIGCGIIGYLLADWVDTNITPSHWFVTISGGERLILSNLRDEIAIVVIGPIGWIFPIGINVVCRGYEKVKAKFTRG
jgi:hypothetical protein